MARTAAQFLGNRLRGGVVISAGDDDAPPPLEGIVGSHPLPTADSERAGRRAIEIAESAGAAETLLVLLSGGASSLMAVPADGVTLDDKRRTTERLLRGGADIHALNTVRKHLSAIKGGWLAARAPGRSITFALSDVVGDDLAVIASGPTVADATTFADALAQLELFGGAAAYPGPVVTRLEAGARGELPDTPKPNDARLRRSTASVVGGRHDAMSGAASAAADRGYHVVQIDEAVIGESRTAAAPHVRAALARAAHVARPTCIVSSGETTVHVVGHGRGGRNQELALAVTGTALYGNSGGDPSPFAFASVGTDGIDGPTDAAGAIVDSTTLSRARTAGLDPAAYLRNNDAYTFFELLGDLIRTGPTGTNVGDLQVFLFS
jgi:glycerate 2-kinase